MAKFCSNCGKQLNDDDVFCAFCRSRVGGEPKPVRVKTVQVKPVRSQTPQQIAPQADPMPPQQSYVQPLPQDAPVPIPPATPAKKRSPAAAVLSVLAVCLAAAAVLLFVKPGYLTDRDDDDRSSRRKRSESTAAAVADEDSTKASETVTAAPAEPPASAESAVEPPAAETTATTAAATTTTAETAASAPETDATSEADKNTDEDNAAMAEAIYFSTAEKPEFGDFEWCYGQFGLVRDPSESGEQLTNPYAWAGGWKCFIIDTPEDNAETYVRELCSAEISIDGSSGAMTIKHCIYELNGESFDDSVTADFSFTGNITGGKLDVTGSGRITMNYFWKENGREYALGDFMLPDGTEAYIALLR